MTSLKQSTWRERQMDLHPGLNEITFPDTLPNYVQINNLGSSELFFGASIIPDTNVYDKSIAPYGEVLYARDTGLSRCQIYVKGSNKCRVTVISFEDAFNPAAMVSQNVTVSGGSGGGSGGVITGFSVPLPAGNNNIGKVVVTSMPPVSLDLQTLPPGSNSIGKVEVSKLPALPAGTSHIGTVNVANGLTIVDMPPVNLSGGVTITNTEFTVASNTDHYHFNGDVGTTEIVIDFEFVIKNFNYITNDDTVNSLLIAFNDDSTTSAFSGKNGVILLRAGETLADFPKKARLIKMRRTTGSGNVRLLGV